MKQKRREVIILRTTLIDKKLLKVMAKDAGLSLSKYLIKAGLNKNLRSRLTEDELETYKSLVKFQNGLTSTGNLLKKKDPRFNQELHNLVDEIRVHLKNFQ
ncbi:plasmid mobilization protein [Leeuwenhoekiella aequorea]|uniref:Mobilization protein MobC n=2 Tax=Flavobacteriia TaxID=117743 RepID=A0A4Q0PBZ7_9FLAO|nr:hypothetical protein [Leeuwenhoekiella aequorea]AOE06011.1 hypothetical protein [uncultured bacterium]RXG24304.1 hypothetical protein DSM00_90 [Leeuwenhoekiella aequorea]CCF99586.1 mobilization protein BmgB [uncultured Flavobacteriia bacterium]